MKKTLAFVLTAVMSLSLLAGCGSKTTAPDNTNNDQPQQQTEEKLSGSVSTNGSTSMEKVIGALSEQFMADNSGVTVTYDPTGSGAGIEAASNGSCGHRPCLPRPEGRGEGRRPDRDRRRPGRHRRHRQRGQHGRGPDRRADRQDLHR